MPTRPGSSVPGTLSTEGIRQLTPPQEVCQTLPTKGHTCYRAMMQGGGLRGIRAFQSTT